MKKSLLAFSLVAAPLSAFSVDAIADSSYVKNFECASSLAVESHEYSMEVYKKLPKSDFSGDINSLYKKNLSNAQIVAGMSLYHSGEGLNDYLIAAPERRQSLDDLAGSISFDSFDGYLNVARGMTDNSISLIRATENAKKAFNIKADTDGENLLDRVMIVKILSDNEKAMNVCPKR